MKTKALILESVPSKIRTALQLIFASLFIGLCAQIKIPLGFTPVPFTGQVFGVLLAGALLGSRKGALAALFYLIEGCIGLPVWAGGCSGFLHLMGPTGGYLLGYLAQAFLAGWFLEKIPRLNFIKAAAALSACCWLQLALGSVWLSFFVEDGFAKGFFPFIVIDSAKAVMVAAFLRIRRKL
jgi:biotin transport system substrate-specific component